MKTRGSFLLPSRIVRVSASVRREIEKREGRKGEKRGKGCEERSWKKKIERMKLPLWLHNAYCFLFAVHLPYVPASRVQVYAQDFFTSSDH